MKCKICQTELTLLYPDLFDDRYGYPGKFSVYQCPQCAFAQTEPTLGQTELDTLYTNYYPRKSITAEQVESSVQYHQGRLAGWWRWVKGINHMAHYHVQPNTKVLDIGCGNGASLLEIQAQQAEAYGTELDRNIQPIAEKLKLNIHFGTVETANYPDNFFNCITMSQLLEHIPEPVQFLQFVHKKLLPGGKVIMSFPNVNSANRFQTKRGWINWHIPYHLNFFSLDSVKRLAKQTGYTVDSIQTITPTGWIQLQMQMNRYQPTAGKPSPVWLPLASNHQDWSLWRRAWVLGSSIIMSYLAIPYLRWQDSKGNGDSFLVIFSKS